MIKLTQWQAGRKAYNPNTTHGQSIWVNPDLIVSLATQTRMVLQDKEALKQIVSERPTEEVILVCFAGAISEDQLVEQVCETPEEILRIIFFWRQDRLRDDRDALGVRS